MSKLYVDEIHPKTAGGIITTTGLGNVKEQLAMLCDGGSYTVPSGTYTSTNVTALQDFNTTYADLSGSSIVYTPPTGTTMVRYQFMFLCSWRDIYQISHFKLFVDSNEVTKARTTIGAENYLAVLQTFDYLLPIGGSADTSTGRQSTWTSPKTLKMQVRSYSSSYEGLAHSTRHWENASSEEFHIPKLIITALG